MMSVNPKMNIGGPITPTTESHARSIRPQHAAIARVVAPISGVSTGEIETESNARTLECAGTSQSSKNKMEFSKRARAPSSVCVNSNKSATRTRFSMRESASCTDGTTRRGSDWEISVDDDDDGWRRGGRV
jgi:hypothetical protein